MTASMADRLADTRRFYDLLNRLRSRVGGTRRLVECNGRMDWPQRGLYFFCEAGEERSGTGTGMRVVRVGTHGLKAGSRNTLWGRLSQHRGTSRGSGNHRGSIFRLLLGIALARREGIGLPPSWGVGGDPGTAARRLGLDRADVKSTEADLEALVSRYIGDMPFLWLGVEDEPSPASQRGLIERNAIALLRPEAAARCGDGCRCIAARREAPATVGVRSSACSVASRWRARTTPSRRPRGASAQTPARRLGQAAGIRPRQRQFGRGRPRSAGQPLDRRHAVPVAGCGRRTGPGSERGLIERNAIALLSGYNQRVLDPPSVS